MRMEHLMHPRSLSLLVFTSLLLGCVFGKRCTNVFPPLSSHTFRYELLKSNNETLKKEIFSHYHLTPTDESAWLNLLPRTRKMLREEDQDDEHDHEHDWVMMYRKMKNQVGGIGFKGDIGGGFLKEVPLEDVRLHFGSIHWQAQKTNLEYLLLLDNDNLLWSFRKTAGLPTPGKPYGGWEAPDVELRGHFVGHYMSATARMWASTHDQIIKEKMTSLVAELYICQKKLGNGYLSAFPSEFFDRFEALKPVWAPYYTIHKILQGLLDQYTFAGNKQAFGIMERMVDYFYNRVQNVIKKYTIERQWLSLNEETGGMNDVLYQLYAITGNSKHLILAHLFDKPCFLGELAVKADDLSGFHANTHIPIVVGGQMRYDVTGDLLYKEMATFFIGIINSSHTYANGGATDNEHWGDPNRLASSLNSETEEGCTTFNMLKVARHMFTWTKEVAYADYYERSLTNHILSIQRGTEPGVMIYMLPIERGGSKARSYHGWGTQFNSFWCDYGIGVESFSKLGDSIYFEEKGKDKGLYIIQYISSSFKWKSAGILLDLHVDNAVSWHPRLKATLKITTMDKKKVESTLNLRIPFWAHGDGLKVSLNGQKHFHPKPGNFLPITHKWTSGDKISIELPLNFRIEAIQDDRPEFSSLGAILYGPYVLAGLSTGDWDVEKPSSLEASIKSIPSKYNLNLKSLSQESGSTKFVLAKMNGSSIIMEKFTEAGTDVAAGATFRFIPILGAEVIMLEPYDLPGAVLKHQGKDKGLTVVDASEGGESSTFKIVPGLDGQKGSVSLESYDLKGCYIQSNLGVDASVKLSCSSNDDEKFKQAVSFELQGGFSKYNPLSFIMKGKNRNFLLTPLFSIRDESYSVYFNFF